MTRSKAALPRVRASGLVLSLALASEFAAAEAARWPVEPIRFVRGASSAVVRGAVVRGERALHSVEARAGQRMALRIASAEGNAVFQVYAPGAVPRTGDDGVLEVAGDALPGAEDGGDATRWTGVLPRSGAYLVVVGATRGNAAYRLTVAVR